MSGLLTFTDRKNASKIAMLPLKEIFINDHKKCMTCNPHELKGSVINIEKNGLDSPLMVKKIDRGYELISDIKSYYSAKFAGIESVPCIVLNDNDENYAMLNQIQAIHNQSFDFFKEAEEIEKLISHYGMTQEDAALHLGKAQSTVANKLRLLRLTAEERKLIIDNHLTERHARALLRLASSQERLYILNMVIQYGFNVEKTELAVDKIIGHRHPRESYRKRSRSGQSVKTYINTIMKAVEGLESSGFRIDAKRVEHDNCLELRVRIPNNNGYITANENSYVLKDSNLN